MIISDIPLVIYRKDIYTTVTFDAVRKKVKPQVNLLHIHLEHEIVRLLIYSLSANDH